MVDRPSEEAATDPGLFDRFAGAVSTRVARAPFFAACVGLVVLWAPTLFMMDLDSSQLIVNTATTIITFLLVALLQNTQARSDKAAQAKQNAIADGVADLLDGLAGDHPDFAIHARELRQAVGLEDRVGS